MDSDRVIALNKRGEGVSASGRTAPGALPGDVLGEPPFAPRAEPFCKFFGECGGCVAQHMPTEVYAAWKRDAVVATGVNAEVGALVDAHGAGRRRATFHARVRSDGSVESGFMRARSHDIISIDACPLFAPELQSAPAIARACAEAVKGLAKPLDVQVTATLAGLDVDLRGCGPLGPAEVRKIHAVAETHDLARVANHGVALIERRAPAVAFGNVQAVPPAGGFLQATEKGEETLGALAAQAMKGAGRVADLFCGAGAFALRLARDHAVFAADSDADAIATLRRAAAAPGLKGVEAVVRNLFIHPLTAAELSRFDAVLFDPPRAGAAAQAREIAASGVGRVVAISCNAETFARDARTLQDGGFVCEGVTPIDQFRASAHVEIFASFRRAKAKRRRSILG